MITKSYEQQYEELINYAKTQNRHKMKQKDPDFVYYENHHIIPKCLGGSDSSRNKVLLTFNEHLRAHWLLLKIHPTNEKLLTALSYMAGLSKMRAVELDPFELKIIEESARSYKNYTASSEFSAKMSKISRKYFGKKNTKEYYSKRTYRQWHDENGSFRLSNNGLKTSKRFTDMNKANWEDETYRTNRSIQVSEQLRASWKSENCPFRKPEYNSKRQKGVIVNIYRGMINYGFVPTDENWNEICKEYSKVANKRMSDLRKYDKIQKYFGSVSKLKLEVLND